MRLYAGEGSSRLARQTAGSKVLVSSILSLIALDRERTENTKSRDHRFCPDSDAFLFGASRVNRDLSHIWDAKRLARSKNQLGSVFISRRYVICIVFVGD